MNVWEWLKEDRDICMPYTVFGVIIISIVAVAVISLAVMLWSGIANFAAAKSQPETESHPEVTSMTGKVKVA